MTQDGQTVSKRMEFIDDHNQSCRRPDQLVESGNTFGADQSLTTHQFLFNGIQRANRVEQIKIADIANGVWKMFQSVECLSSFEIQKHKMQIIRAVLHGERQAPTDEQFRFSRTRGACYHGMRS